MKLNTVTKISLLFAFLFCVCNPVNAALITTEFSELVDNQGTVDINISLGSDESPAGFSVYFSESLFANLVIITSPYSWDSIIFQPDLLLGAGLFDNYNPLGLVSGFARLSFTYLSDLPFQALTYEFYDADFNITESGTSTNIAASVPESPSLILLLVGLALLSLRRIISSNNRIFHSTSNQQVAA